MVAKGTRAVNRRSRGPASQRNGATLRNAGKVSSGVRNYGTAMSRPGLNPMTWQRGEVVSVAEIKPGFNIIHARSEIAANMNVHKEYKWVRITVTWNPLYNIDQGTVAILPFYDNETAPQSLAHMITAGVRLRNGLNTFTQVISAIGEVQFTGTYPPVAPATTGVSKITGGVAMHVVSPKAITDTIGWARIHWEWMGRFPLNAVTLGNPTI